MKALPASLLAFGFFAGSFAAPAAHAFSSGFMNPQTYVGHEEITRQSLREVLALLEARGITEFSDNSTAILHDLAAAPGAPAGKTSSNPVIQGNYAADFPSGPFPVALADFFGISRHQWDVSPQGQSLHFLRNYLSDISIASAKETCLDARSKIKKVTAAAVAAWKAGNKTMALFLLGTATHTIQDSFSQAHTRRASKDYNFNLQDVCYYGVQMNDNMAAAAGHETCYHGWLDHNDSIWISSLEELHAAQANWPEQASSNCKNSIPGTEEEKQRCLKSEARLAREASSKYLTLVFLSLRSLDASSLVSLLDEKLFDGNNGAEDPNARLMPQGIARCELLSDKRFVGIQNHENPGN